MQRKILLYLLFVLLSANTNAQLNGVYTIGGTTPDYATFTDAVADLTSLGISGNVTFDVRSGTYAEKVSIPAIAGTSSIHTITFQSEVGDSSAVILVDTASTSSTNNYTLQLTDADYVTIKKMTIQRSGTGTYANVIAIGNNSVNNKFQNNHILGITATTSSTNNALIYAASGGTSIDSNNIFSNNFFENGSYGMYFNGQSAAVLEGRNSVVNNIFRNQYARYIYMLYQSNPTIGGNDCATNSTYATMYGIYLSNSLNGLITRNKILLSGNSGYGIYLTSSDGTSSTPLYVANNMIHIGGNGTAYGTYMSGSTYIALYYNSVNITGTGTTSRCLHITGTATLGVDVANNIFVNAGGGHAYYVVGLATAGIHLTNFNDLYTTGAVLGFWTAAVADLSAFQAASGMEANSVSADPIFSSPSDLHVNGSAVNNMGTPVAAFNTDFDGEVRSAGTPDMGADEFIPLTDNVGVVSLVSPGAGGCGDSSTVVGVSLRNFGSNQQTGIPLTAEITGAITQTLTGTYTGTLGVNAQDTFYFATPLVTAGGGVINITVYSALATDQNKFNDTIYAARSFSLAPPPPTVLSPQDVCDNNAIISATADTGNVLFWYDQPGGNLLYVGNPFTPVISTDTVFYVSQHQGSGSTGCLRITECGLSTNDFLEIENLSGVSIDATGWVAVISNSYTDINSVNTLAWNLDFFNAGEIKYKSDNANDNYWGNNMLWNNGSDSWAMIVDNAGNVIDFVAWGWTDAEIQTLLITVNGFTVTIGPEWSGNAPVACASPNSINRIGTADNNNASDMVCAAETKGTHNVNLAGAFTDCGVGVCGSVPIAVDVHIIPGITVVLPADTMLIVPFSYNIDAGAGFTSYLWSTGETTQSITVTTGNIYWVTVTGANGCEASDTILVNFTVGSDDFYAEDALNLYPNPSSGNIELSGLNSSDGECKIVVRDLRGKEMLLSSTNGNISKTQLDVSALPDGIYFISVISDKRVLGKMMHVIH